MDAQTDRLLVLVVCSSAVSAPPFTWQVQAETRCSGSRPLAWAWLRRDVLPSMAMVSGALSRRLSTQAIKQP